MWTAPRTLVSCIAISTIVGALSAPLPTRPDGPRTITLADGDMIGGYVGKTHFIVLPMKRGPLTLRDLRTGDIRLEIPGDFCSSCWIPQQYCQSAVTFLNRDDVIEVWSLRNGKRILAHKVLEEGIDDPIISPDGRYVAYQYFDPQRAYVRFLELPSGRIVTTLAGPLCSADSLKSGNAYAAVGFSPDRRHFAMSTNNEVQIRNVSNGRLRLRLTGHDRRVVAATFSRDGRRLLSQTLQKAIVWNVDDGAKIAELRLPSIQDDAWDYGYYSISADGRYVLGEGERDTVVWKLPAGTIVQQFPGRTSPNRSRFEISPDGQRLLEFGRGLIIHDFEDPAAVSHRMPSELAYLHSLSPDGRWIAEHISLPQPPSTDRYPNRYYRIDRTVLRKVPLVR